MTPTSAPAASASRAANPKASAPAAGGHASPAGAGKSAPDLRKLDYQQGRAAVSPAPTPAGGPKPDAGQQPGEPADLMAMCGLQRDDAPGQVRIDDPVYAEMQAAWLDSGHHTDKPLEQGGIVVRDKQHAAALKRGPPGAEGHFKPNYGDRQDGEVVIGTAHTHPYKKFQGSGDMTFSAKDLANFVKVPDQFRLLQAGDSRFMAVRTGEFNAKRLKYGLDDEQQDLAIQDMVATYDAAYKATKSPSAAIKSEMAVRATCKAWDLLYYRGLGQTLDKVDLDGPQPPDPTP